MNNPRIVVRATAALAFCSLTLALPGCGGSSTGTEGPARIPVINPDPKDPYSGITLENEAQNIDRLPANVAPRKK